MMGLGEIENIGVKSDEPEKKGLVGRLLDGARLFLDKMDTEKQVMETRNVKTERIRASIQPQRFGNPELYRLQRRYFELVHENNHPIGEDIAYFGIQTLMIRYCGLIDEGYDLTIGEPKTFESREIFPKFVSYVDRMLDRVETARAKRSNE